MLTLPPDEFNLKMLKASPFSGAMEPDIFHHLLVIKKLVNHLQ